MRFLACPRGTEVARAARGGTQAPELAAHLAGCADCREATWIAARLQASARATLASGGPPDPAGLWRRGTLEREIARRRDLARRAARPVRLFQRWGAVLGLAATAAWMLRGDAGWQGALARVTGTGAPDPTVLALAAGAILALALVATHEALLRVRRL